MLLILTLPHCKIETPSILFYFSSSVVTYHLCYLTLRILISRIPEPNKYTMEAGAVPSQAIYSYHYLLPLNPRFPVYAFESRNQSPLHDMEI